MTALLCDRLGIGARELVSIVGAGGKSSIMFSLSNELATSAKRVILTTTTKIAQVQVIEPTCWSDDPTDVEEALLPGTPLLVVTGEADEKVIGLTPVTVDRLYTATSADYVLVEADGARSRSIKAPGNHEPVIPRSSTTVIVVVGIDAIGQPLRDVAHRPDRIAALTGLGYDDDVTVKDAATVLLHPEGSLKGIPPTARVVVAITKVSRENTPAANSLITILEAHPRVERAVMVADDGFFRVQRRKTRSTHPR